MNPKERWTHICTLDEELSKGGVILSEWCALIVREADTAFAAGAYLGAILVAVAAIETHLRAEASDSDRPRLVDLIDRAMVPSDLKSDLHELRRYRNRWVHVDDRWSNQEPLADPQPTDAELKRMALFALRTLRRTIYANPWV